jgi:fructose-bisphosphate aldolase class II
MAITGQYRKVAAEKQAEFDPRNFNKPAIAAMTEICIDRYERFGTAGQASAIKPIPLPAMAQRYKSGDLDPTIN